MDAFFTRAPKQVHRFPRLADRTGANPSSSAYCSVPDKAASSFGELAGEIRAIGSPRSSALGRRSCLSPERLPISLIEKKASLEIKRQTDLPSHSALCVAL